ncbi:uncharacterized protein L3040_003488 [Drepanopeziza brunnea f. sp. 'multigermtubi']|uniref:uncharacterized protein n=1 Tax=Drepanopeziza brunnea f. sp. 'multigermtubi' TaxID=698441 RepID=UPI002390E8ED|nr:hypothetical protein L3040_003488 [Drepanopeziza brunnea f. sp. 'multigermtubi']
MAAAVLDLSDAKFPQLGKTAIPAQNGSNRPKRSQTVTGRGGRGRPLSNPQQASVITFRKYGDKFKPETYSPGDVISVPFHIADYEQPPVNPGIHSSLCKLGPYVYSKFRRLIILDCYVDHCVAIPLFTNNGAGLKKKVAKGEWVGVRDAADPDPRPSETVHGNVFVRRDEKLRYPDDSSNPSWMKSTTHAHHAHPVSFRYDRFCIRIGELSDPEDVARLRALLHKRCPLRHDDGSAIIARLPGKGATYVGPAGQEPAWWKEVQKARVSRAQKEAAASAAAGR